MFFICFLYACIDKVSETFVNFLNKSYLCNEFYKQLFTKFVNCIHYLYMYISF